MVWGPVQFIIPQEPVAKVPPSYVRGRVINESRDQMKRWTDAARHFVPEQLIKYRGPVAMQVTSVFRRPQKHYKRGLRGGEDRLMKCAPREHYQKPDADNLAKFVGDCLSGLAFHDDCQIADLRVHKRWNHSKSYTKVAIIYLNKDHFGRLMKKK